MLHLSFVAASSFVASPSHRSPAVCRSAGVRCSFAAVEQASSRDASFKALEALKEDGTATLWNQYKLARRPVSLQELTALTKLDAKVLDPTASDFELEDIQDIAVKVLIGCTVASFAWAIGSDALGLDAGLRFTGTYLLAGIPIAGLAIGSTAPGLLFLPIEAWRSIGAGEEEKRSKAQRVCRHEASHLLCAYVLGLPVQGVETGAKGPQVRVFDEELSQQPGMMVSAEKVDALAVVAVSGLMAEAAAFGKALGASEDLKLLGSILVRCSPPIPNQQQQDLTRYAALSAWTIINKYEAAYDAIAGDRKSVV